jgi:hypothetical protein
VRRFGAGIATNATFMISSITMSALMRRVLIGAPLDKQLRYCHGRDGDHLLTPFQCNLC